MLGLIGGLVSAGLNFIGGKKQLKAQEKANFQNAELQREFAQNSIRWRVADAKAAGLHPLAAIGAQGSQASPSFQAGDYGFLGQAGQDVGTAINRTLSPGRQATRYATAAAKLSLQNMELRNQMLASQIAKERAAPSPGIPALNERSVIDGQPNSGMVAAPPGTVVTVPKRRHAAVPGKAHIEVGSNPEVAYIRSKYGYAPVPSKHAKEGIEDMWGPSILWQLRNNVLPLVGVNTSVPPYNPGKGKYWQITPMGDYRPFRKKKPWDYLRR